MEHVIEPGTIKTGIVTYKTIAFFMSRNPEEILKFQLLLMILS
jgi:hypothetical protein